MHTTITTKLNVQFKKKKLLINNGSRFVLGESLTKIKVSINNMVEHNGLRSYQDEQQQEGRQDKCSEGVGNHRGRLLLWFSE